MMMVVVVVMIMMKMVVVVMMIVSLYERRAPNIHGKSMVVAVSSFRRHTLCVIGKKGEKGLSRCKNKRRPIAVFEVTDDSYISKHREWLWDRQTPLLMLAELSHNHQWCLTLSHNHSVCLIVPQSSVVFVSVPQPLVMNLACVTLHMTMAEAVVAASLNAAHALGQSDLHGSVETGKLGNLVILDAPR